MNKYHKRVITYDEHTQNYKVEVPGLGLEVLADTEASGLIFIREEIEAYIKRQSQIAKTSQLVTSEFEGFGD